METPSCCQVTSLTLPLTCTPTSPSPPLSFHRGRLHRTDPREMQATLLQVGMRPKGWELLFFTSSQMLMVSSCGTPALSNGLGGGSIPTAAGKQSGPESGAVTSPCCRPGAWPCFFCLESGPHSLRLSGGGLSGTGPPAGPGGLREASALHGPQLSADE